MLSTLLALLLAVTGIPRTADAELIALAEQRASEITVTNAHRALPELDNGRWDGWGEVIAYRGGDATPLPEIVAGWMTSPTHATVLTAPQYDAIGCGFEWSGVRLYVACIVADSRVAADPPITSPPPTTSKPPPAVTVLPDTSIQEPS